MLYYIRSYYNITNVTYMLYVTLCHVMLLSWIWILTMIYSLHTCIHVQYIALYLCPYYIYIHTYIHVFLWHLGSSWHPGLTYLHLYPQVGRWMICSRARTSIGFPIWWVPFLSIFLDFKSSSIPSRKTYDISILMQWCLDDQNMLGWL